MMSVEIRALGPDDADVLANVADDVFDEPIDPSLVREFLCDPRHHISVAIEGGCVVGFASGVHYLHPDKSAELFVNEVGVASTHRRRGIARRVLFELIAVGRAAGCRSAWILTDPDNEAAIALYTSVGAKRSPDPPVMFELHIDAECDNDVRDDDDQGDEGAA